ncbi:CHAT domain-containing protein [Leptothermofonsia sp. ETS-13]|uniref:CHAT domain-containing protein n=1 Tax=Leptothermofonsia sp. ETS-13 TaxID=3035696 RepID=UPI003BA1C9EF
MSWFSRRFVHRILLFIVGASLCIFAAVVEAEMPGLVAAQSVSYGQLVDQGVQSYQAGKYPEAIATWEQALRQPLSPSDRATVQSNLGQAYRQVGQPDKAIAQWEQAIQFYKKQGDGSNQQALAQLLTEQAQAYSDLGQHKTAIDRLQAAIELAQKNQDDLTEAAAQGALGNAHWALGAYEDALTAHQKSLELACRLDNQSYITTALNNLGNVFVSRSKRFRYQSTAASLEGDSTTEQQLTRQANHDNRVALAAYLRSAEISRSVSNLAEAKALLNLNRLLDQLPVASPVSMPELACETLNFKALLSPSEKSLPSPSATSNRELMAQNRTRILALLELEPDSQDKAYGYINLANSHFHRANGTIQEPVNLAEVNPILQKALTTARNIGDARAESYALGTLGEAYESNRQYDEAMSLSRQAQFTAQRMGANDSLYRWQWQMGRILKTLGQTERAIASYEQAVATLQSIRDDIVITNQDLQFDFRDSVEPVYRQLIGLLLSQEAGSSGQWKLGARGWGEEERGEEGRGKKKEERNEARSQELTQNSKLKTQDSELKTSLNPNTRNISKVLDLLELLKLAELQNFFGDDCVQLARDAAIAEQPLPPDRNGQEPIYGLIDPKAAVVYSVILEDRAYMILRLPNGTLKEYPVQIRAAEVGAGAKSLSTQFLGETQLQARIDQLRLMLEKRATEEYLTEAQAVYDALIRPMEADLEEAKPTTLVFVNDGVLRKVPMSALHDGKQFLIEKYPIATTPSLSLTTRRPFERRNLQALILGLTIEQEPFGALPNVREEVAEVEKILGGTKLLDQAFTLRSMQQRLQKNSYRIIHMATHGKFGADANSTYLQAYQDRITINQLDDVLRSRQSQEPVELLTLSACQTAAGDNRSALGIAGVAVRAGVKSAVATLWFINDEATVPLIEEFYTQLLQPNITKAEALRKAQLKLIGEREYNHPAVWSPFILIGNWL